MEEVLEDIDHVALVVDHVGRAVAWYQETAKCHITYQDETWALLKFSNISLALVTEGQHPPHIAFVKDNAHEYGPLKSHRDGTASTYIRDASGNFVEILKRQP